jgi:glycosyltransferase involved in cell wall biosynthesis
MTTMPATPVTMNPSSARTETPLSGPRRVCHLSLGLSTGGLERLLVDMARFHDRAAWSLSFVALNEVGGPGEEIRAAGCDVTGLHLQGASRWTAIRRLSRLFREQRIDVVHTHNAYPHLVGTLAAKWAGVPVVIHTRHGQRFGHGWKSRWSFRLAAYGVDRIVAVSDDAAKLCVAGDGIPQRQVLRIWNGIDCDKFAFHGGATSPTAISVARLSKEKDFPTLLRAAALVHAQVPEFRLRIVGGGPEMPRLEAVRDELGLGAVVELLGERRDVPELLKTAGFFVSSSLTEGVSLTLLEAMAVGLPILATNVGGNPEVVEPGVTGELVPAGDPQPIAEGMLRMLSQRSLWPVMAEAARRRVETHFDIRQMVAGYEALYGECLAAKTGQAGQSKQTSSHTKAEVR